MNIETKVVEALKAALATAENKGPIPLHEPVVGANELEYVKKCVESTFVS